MAGDDLLLRHRQDILAILTAALRAVDPSAALRAHVELNGPELRIGSRTYDLQIVERIVVIGAGKAGAPMASALHGVVGPRITAGFVSVKYGHTAGVAAFQVRFGRIGPETRLPAPTDTGRIVIHEAGHPVPDDSGQAGAEAIVSLLRNLTERDLVIVLLSGGGSALLPLPAAGITLTDLQSLTAILLACGANIAEINTVRKHCSQLQGGQMARLAAPAQVSTLVLSDVVGTPLDAIASGPTVPDPTHFADAHRVLERYRVLDQVPRSIRVRIEAGVAGGVPDTPKPGDPLFERVDNVVIGDNVIAGQAAVAEAVRRGWDARLLTTFLQGEAREIGRVAAGIVQGMALGQPGLRRPACLVLGGETTVTIRGKGQGGRNQELALSAAIALDEYRNLSGPLDIAVVALATDGNDGPTDAAGGIATPETVACGERRGLDARAALDANNSYAYLSALGSLVVTGPTNTNVNDLLFLFSG